MAQRYDIIGDVHGMRGTLQRLLHALGYRCVDGLWSHPSDRSLVFVGDIVDRGPDPLGSLELVEEMVAQGVALLILGNHELNALHYMSDPPLRPHSEKNTKQFASTLAQIEAAPERWTRARKFLTRCPTRLELDEGRLRVIHACWDESINRLPLKVDDEDLLCRTSKSGDLVDAVENCLKGPEEPCTPFRDKDGHERSERRIPWWATYPADDPFIVFGHYWFPWPGGGAEYTPSSPELLGPGSNVACVDYSVGKGGPLVALRYPERKFVQVPCSDPLG